MSKLRATAKAHPRFATVALLAILTVPFVAIGAGPEILNRPFVQGVLTFRGNAEQIDNNTDDMVEFQGTGGTDNTDLRADLDGALPVLDSPTDTAVGIDDDLTFIGAQSITTSAGALTLAPAAGLVMSMDATSGFIVRNNATGSVLMSLRDYADTTDDDMAHTLFTTNCTDTGSGTEDCDFSIGIVEAGAAPVTRLNFDADGDTTLGGTNAADVVLQPDDQVVVRNTATGNVVFSLSDFADTTDDDMAHGQIIVNCTDTGTGAEDCDFSIGVVEAGAAPETRFICDADGGCTLGSANNNSLAFTTDGTGDAEADYPDESINAGDILNLLRSIPLPTSAWYDCTADAIISTDDGADAQPDWAFLNSGIVIAYDDTGGSPDTNFVCTGFRVPPDYVSGARMAFVVSQDAATATIEDIGCAWSINGAADSGETTAVLVSQIAAQVVTVTPAGAVAAGDSLGVRCRQSDAAPDDIVYFHAIEFNYTAVQ